MACNDPLVGWKSKETTALGKRAVVFDVSEGYKDLPINLPCGKCWGCRNDRAIEWALRCSHEAQLYPENCFLTLTYKEDPKTKEGIPTLRKRDFTLFMKKLRRRRKGRISFFQCGEYGGSSARPHHHAILFNCNFGDRRYWRKKGDYNLYRSEELEKLWEWGFSEIGTVTFQSAGYVAGYTLKETLNTENKGRVAEYRTMSKRPAIGKTWLQKYIRDVYPTDEVITRNGNKMRPPKYYDKLLEQQNPELLRELKTQRRENLTEETKAGTRRMAREKILKAKATERRKQL